MCEVKGRVYTYKKGNSYFDGLTAQETNGGISPAEILEGRR